MKIVIEMLLYTWWIIRGMLIGSIIILLVIFPILLHLSNWIVLTIWLLYLWILGFVIYKNG